MFETLKRKRKREGIREDVLGHFDIPLMLPHEMVLLKRAGFQSVEAVVCVNGAVIITASNKKTLVSPIA